MAETLDEIREPFSLAGLRQWRAQPRWLREILRGLAESLSILGLPMGPPEAREREPLYTIRTIPPKAFRAPEEGDPPPEDLRTRWLKEMLGRHGKEPEHYLRLLDPEKLAQFQEIEMERRRLGLRSF